MSGTNVNAAPYQPAWAKPQAPAGASAPKGPSANAAPFVPKSLQSQPKPKMSRPTPSASAPPAQPQQHHAYSHGHHHSHHAHHAHHHSYGHHSYHHAHHHAHHHQHHNHHHHAAGFGSGAPYRVPGGADMPGLPGANVPYLPGMHHHHHHSQQQEAAGGMPHHSMPHGMHHTHHAHMHHHHQHQHYDPAAAQPAKPQKWAPAPKKGSPVSPQKAASPTIASIDSVDACPSSSDATTNSVSSPATEKPAFKGIQPAKSNLPNPAVFLFLGPRGSGKSTQAKIVAEKYNLLYIASGDIVRDSGRNPFLVLPEIIQKEFIGKNYKGLALDRFVATAETDVYFLQHILKKFDLQIDLAFTLTMDYDEAMKRAEDRNDKKVKSYQRRMMEHRAVYETSTNVFEPIGSLRPIPCDDDRTIDDIAHEIHLNINEYLAKGLHSNPLQELCFKGNKAIVLNSDFELMARVKTHVSEALGRDAKFSEFFPGSSMTGLMDGQEFDKLRRRLGAYYVTAKADGQRALLVKHEEGLFLFPSNYQAMYELTPTPPSEVKEPKQLKEFPGMSMSKPISYICDSEVIEPKEGTERVAVYVFDFLFFFGLRGTQTLFPKRYELISSYFGLKNVWGKLHCKKYIEAYKIGELMPEYGEGMPFPIDGLIFQHPDKYRVPKDPNVYKWKPRDMCTVDFRLCDGEEDEKTKVWTFYGKVSVKTETGVDEETFPDTLIQIPEDVVIAENLADGTVAECLKTDQMKRIAGKPHAIWSFFRSRPDKLTPNIKDIALFTANMKHLNYQQLKQRCATVAPAGLPQ